jgi:predicted transcriptional regulator|tara:strand:+ start:117 stop:371 length:255 start_codon:yes stop_codon:yes gene_type:complete
MKPDFDINFIIEQTKNSLGSEAAIKGVRNLVQKGLIQQYTDKDGNFRFSLTEEGESIAEFLYQNPNISLDDNDNDNDKEKRKKD